MRLCLGIDGGGTGCRAALADAQGRILGRGEGGPANIASDPEGAAANILTAARMAAGDQDLGALTAVLGLAGANVPAAADALRARLPFAGATILSDAVTAARGALGAADGIVAALGTGSVFARQQGGRVRQFGGRGFVLGDEGSGAVLGRTLLSRALRAEDGFEAMTPLLADVLKSHGGPEGVIAFALSARPADFAALAPRLLDPDPAAEAILAGATAEIAAIIDRLQDGARLPVVFLGGLGPRYAARLAGRWDLRRAQGNGLDGAVALAAEALGPA